MKKCNGPQEWQGAGPETALFLSGDNQCVLTQLLAGTELMLLDPFQGSLEWRHRHLIRADAISFWLETVCPIVWLELGIWLFRPKKIFVGSKLSYDEGKTDVETLVRLERPNLKIATSVEEFTAQVIEWEQRVKVDRFQRDPEQPGGFRG